MGIPPKEFWDMGLKELYLAIEGYAEVNSDGSDTPMSRDDLGDLMELYPD